MTPAQTNAYWRLWGGVCRANRWTTVAGAIHPSAVLEATPIHGAVWEAAEALAKRSAGAITADTMRHACHIVALGRDKSSKTIGNGAEATRLFALLRLLVNPDDLQARMDFDDRDADTRRRLLWRLSRTGAPEAYIRKIVADKFGTSADPRTLPLDQLQQLITTLSNRTRGFRKPLPEHSNTPF